MEPIRAVAPAEAQPFAPGDPVTLIDGKGRRFFGFLQRDARLHLTGGYVESNALVGTLPGARVRTSRGHTVAAYRTTLEEYVLLMPRAATVVPPKDIAFLVQWADVFPGALVVEAGIGSGGLTLGLLRAVGPRGRVVAFELRPDHANRARKNIEAWPDTRGVPLDIRLADVHTELGALHGIDRVLLDLPDPHRALDGAARALKPGGLVAAYVPGIRQIDGFALAVLDHPDFAEPEVVEVMARPWVADHQRLRPELRIVGHTGFLARARRRGPYLHRPESTVAGGGDDGALGVGEKNATGGDGDEAAPRGCEEIPFRAMAPAMNCPKLVRVPGQGVEGPVVIAIMDGIGLGPGDEADAVAKAETPHLARIARESLSAQLRAHGRAVGMPSDEDMGNSEVGHNALGAGRVFDQGAKLVQAAIEGGALFAGDVWREIVASMKEHGGALHLIGLLSDGNVHSHIEHLLALLRRADTEGLPRAYVHVLLDGRDVPKTSALEYVDQLEAALADIRRQPGRDYRIASGGGRMVITMDRYEADWGMVERGWRTHVEGQGRQFPTARQAIETYRAEKPGIIDQDLPPFVIADDGRPVAPVRDGDAVIAYNFRGDRMLELVRAFEDEAFDKFARGPRPAVLFAAMTLYDGDTQRPKRYLVPPPQIRCTLGELLAHAGVSQLAVSETQKFGHVTYFWNGNRTGTFDPQLERYIEIPSHPPPFDERPAMRAREISETVLRELASRDFGLVRLNYANGDMVGHTGNFAATVEAVTAVDAALGLLIEPVLARRGALVVTADHGNADDMAERDKKTGALLRDPQGRMIPKTSHSLRPVPFYVLLAPEDRSRFALAGLEQPGLGHVAATLAVLRGFAPPAEYLPSILRPVR